MCWLPDRDLEYGTATPPGWSHWFLRLMIHIFLNDPKGGVRILKSLSILHWRIYFFQLVGWISWRRRERKGPFFCLFIDGGVLEILNKYFLNSFIRSYLYSFNAVNKYIGRAYLFCVSVDKTNVVPCLLGVLV